MADAKLVELAKQVVLELNAGTFETAFTARRSYLPKRELAETDGLQVTVAMNGWRTAPDSRADWIYEYDIGIGVQFRANASQGIEPLETFDIYVRLLEQIADFYRFTRPTTADAVLTTVQYGGPTGLPYFPEHIEQFNQITGVVILTFQKERS